MLDTIVLKIIDEMVRVVL